MGRIGVNLAACLLLSRELPAPHQAAPPTPDIAPAAIVKVPSAALGGEFVATILLPSTYADSRARYPVLYLLHGGGQDHTAFATRAWFRAQRSRGMIIVTPSVGDSWYVNSVANPKLKYEDFLVKDLVELRRYALPNHRLPRGPGHFRRLYGCLGRNVAGFEAPSALRRSRRAECAVRDFATSSGHGHDIPDTAAVRRAWDTRAS